MNKGYLIKLSSKALESDIGYGDVAGNAIGATVGRINNYFNPLSAFQHLALSPRMILNPTESAKGSYSVEEQDRKGQMYKELMTKMLEQNPEQLKDVRVNLGGPRYLNDIYRALTNSRTFPLLRPLYALSTPLMDFQANIGRADHYNPVNNTVTLYSDSPAILTHELGHAIDINSWGLGGTRDEEKEAKQSVLRRAVTKLMRNVKNLPRDAYVLSRSIFANDKAPYYNPLLSKGITLWQEAMANTRSLLNIRKSLKDNPKALENLYILRNKTLPAAYSTYLMGAVGPLDLSLYIRGLLGAKFVGEMSNISKHNTFKSEYSAYHDFMDAMLDKNKKDKADKKDTSDKKESKNE